MTVVCQLFTEYARQALGEDVERPFQKLQLLVRDWATPHLALFGPEGGKQLFNHLMQETNQQTEEAHWMRQRIRDSFAEISCFLMPHPGKKVTIEENYDGKVAGTTLQVAFPNQGGYKSIMIVTLGFFYQSSLNSRQAGQTHGLWPYPWFYVARGLYDGPSCNATVPVLFINV
uniref:(California timema) hypothetical protein n=1 Tax=Timema californicum TaxID=61474 RepID=A0A7R9PEJ5_TIMCA|nr:unnamed protein product [Timema californicum]